MSLQKFPAAAILAPPSAALVIVPIFKLLISNGSSEVRIDSTPMALLLFLFLILLWLGPVVELLALPIGAVMLWRDPEKRTRFRLGVLLVGCLYLAAFVWWLATN